MRSSLRRRAAPSRWRARVGGLAALAVAATTSAGAVVGAAPAGAASRSLNHLASRSAAATATTTWTQRAHFVNDAYRAFGLGNASAADIDTWSQLIGTGGSRLLAANDATNNGWWRGNLVDQAYWAVLGRAPASNSRAARVATLAAGGTRAGLYAALYGSSEFFQIDSGGKAATFITKLFTGTVGRPPTAAELSGWTARLAGGTTTLSAATSLVGSVSARGLRVDADYKAFLGRAATPTIRSHWITNLGTEDELVLEKSLVVSDEFFADAQAVALPSGTAPPPSPPATVGGRVVALAESQLGVTYVWGGETPGVGFDCSGLAQWAYGVAGVTIPRTTYDQVLRPTAETLAKIQPGDLVFYWGSGHVAIYVGNGLVVHAPAVGDVVRFASVDMGTPEHIVRPG